MIELVVANVNIFPTVVPEGETEPLAGAAQSGRHQIGGVQPLESGVRFRYHRQAHQSIKADAQLLALLLATQGEGLFQVLQGHGLRVRQVVKQVSDRELHREVDAGSGRTRLGCGMEGRPDAGHRGGDPGPGCEVGERAGSQPLAGPGKPWPSGAPGGDRLEKERVPGVGGCLGTGRPGTGCVGIRRPGPVVPLPNLCSL